MSQTPTVGIDALHFYVPPLYLPIENLAEAREIAFAKLNQGLGLERMAVPDADEDVVTFAAEAAARLIEAQEWAPRQIRKLFLGTESAVDSSKPTATYVLELLERYLTKEHGPRCLRHCDAVDFTFACVGGIDALESALHYVRLHPDQEALVIATDLAQYDLGSGGEYTQGAGAVALRIRTDPRLLAIQSATGVATESVGDFFKPRRSFQRAELLQAAARLLGQELSTREAQERLQDSKHPFWGFPGRMVEEFRHEPVFDGPYSNDCYQNRVEEALQHWEAQQAPTAAGWRERWQHLIFHLPYAFQARRMFLPIWLEALQKNDQAVPEEIQATLSILQDNPQDAASWKALRKSEAYSAFVARHIAPSEKASAQIGNMYSASIFMALISMLDQHLQADRSLVGEEVGLLAYGSGSKSKVLSGHLVTSWAQQVQPLDLQATLQQRQAIDFKTYEALHTRAQQTPVVKKKRFALRGLANEENRQGYRLYELNA